MKLSVTDIRVTVEGREIGDSLGNRTVAWSGTLDEYRDRLDDLGAYLVFTIRDEDAWTMADYDHGTITSKGRPFQLPYRPSGETA
jgi:hypothetical protein